MKKVIVLVCLLGSAGLWGWALFTHKAPPTLDARYCGKFRLYRFEPPEGVTMPNPVPAGQTHFYEFRADGSYTLSIVVSEGYEMLSRSGLVTEENGILTLTQLAMNRRAAREDPVRWRTRWGQDEGGRFLELVHEREGYSYFLRPQAG